jgi:hypothetical protein
MIDDIIDYADPFLMKADRLYLIKYIQHLHKKYKYTIWQESYFYDRRPEGFHKLDEKKKLLWKIMELEYIGSLISRKRI